LITEKVQPENDLRAFIFKLTGLVVTV